jgi:hypothetical protein
VTSVALTAPGGFSVSGSPVTTSGTLAITTSLSGLLKGTGSAFTTAAAADVYGLWSGTCSSSTFLRGDGACAAAGGGGTPGGSNTQIQYNNAGAFGGVAGFTWNGTTLVDGVTSIFTGAITFNSLATTGVTIGEVSSLPDIAMLNVSATANYRAWENYADGTTLHFRAMNDAYSSSQDWLAVLRSGATITSLTFPNGGLVAGSPTGGSQGTGTINATGYYLNGTQTVFTATSASIGGSALAAGACSSTTTTVTGATTSMMAQASPAGGTDPGVGNYWQAFVSTTNQVTVRICATVAGTPTATTYNVRVFQ